MSSWPPHLPIAMTASRASRRVVAHPLAGDGQRGVEGAGGEVGELGGGVVDAEVVGQVAGGQAEQDAGGTPPAARPPPRRRAGRGRRRSSCGSAPTAREQLLADGVRRGAGRAHRRVGELAPVLGVAAEVVGQRLAGAEHREQPHRGALVVDERPRASARPPAAPRPRPAGPARRARGRGRRCGRAGRAAARPASPSAARFASDCSGSWKPSRVRCPSWWRVWLPGTLRAPGSGRWSQRDVGEARGQRRPGVVELLPGLLDLGEQRVGVEAAVGELGPLGVGDPGADDRLVDLGVQLDAPGASGAKRADLDLAVRGLRQDHRAGGRLDHEVVVPLDAAARGGQPARRAGRRAASSVQPTSSSPTCWPRGLGVTRPPSAAPSSWWPRQMPRVGTPSATASRISSLTGPIQSSTSSSLALIAPPMHQQPGVPVEGRAPASPAYGWRTSSMQPASSSQSPNRCGGSSTSGCTTRIRFSVTRPPRRRGAGRGTAGRAPSAAAGRPARCRPAPSPDSRQSTPVTTVAILAGRPASRSSRNAGARGAEQQPGHHHREDAGRAVLAVGEDERREDGGQHRRWRPRSPAPGAAGRPGPAL